MKTDVHSVKTDNFSLTQKYEQAHRIFSFTKKNRQLLQKDWMYYGINCLWGLFPVLSKIASTEFFNANITDSDSQFGNVCGITIGSSGKSVEENLIYSPSVHHSFSPLNYNYLHRFSAWSNSSPQKLLQDTFMYRYRFFTWIVKTLLLWHFE